MISKDTRWVITETLIIILVFILVNMFLDFYKMWYWDTRVWLGW